MNQQAQYVFYYVLVYLATCIMFMYLSSSLARHKGYGGYYVFGFFFGLIGLLYVIGLPDLNYVTQQRAIVEKLDTIGNQLNVRQSNTSDGTTSKANARSETVGSTPDEAQINQYVKKCLSCGMVHSSKEVVCEKCHGELTVVKE
jgi:hypothetical protein